MALTVKEYEDFSSRFSGPPVLICPEAESMLKPAAPAPRSEWATVSLASSSTAATGEPTAVPRGSFSGTLRCPVSDVGNRGARFNGGAVRTASAGCAEADLFEPWPSRYVADTRKNSPTSAPPGVYEPEDAPEIGTQPEVPSEDFSQTHTTPETEPSGSDTVADSAAPSWGCCDDRPIAPGSSTLPTLTVTASSAMLVPSEALTVTE